METPTDRSGYADSCASGTGAGGAAGGGLLIALVALACPLVCLGPLLLAGLAATGLVRAVQGASWPLIVGLVLVVLALGVWGVRARQTRACSAPTPTVRDGATSPE